VERMTCRTCPRRYWEYAGDGTVIVWRCEVTEQIIKKGQVCPLEDMEVKGWNLLSKKL
jgi:hypothetical protein